MGRIPGDLTGGTARRTSRRRAVLFPAALLAAGLTSLLAAPSPSPTPVPISISISKEMASANGWNLPARSFSYSARWYSDRYGAALKGYEIQRVDWAGGRVIVQFIQPAPGDENRFWAGLQRDKTPNAWLARQGGVILVVLADTADVAAKIQRTILPEATASSAEDYAWIPAEIPGSIPNLRPAAWRFDPDVAAQEYRVRGISLVGVYQANFDFSQAHSLAERPAQISLWVPRHASDLDLLARRLNEFPQPNRRVLVGKRCAVLIIAAKPEASELLAGALQPQGYRAVASETAPATSSTPTAKPAERPSP